MTKLELLTVLRSIDLALKKGAKEDVEALIATLIKDAESDRKTGKE